MTKELRAKIRTRSEGLIEAIYRDIDGQEELKGFNIVSVIGYAFCDGKMVLVWSDKKGTWAPPGGGVETGENVYQAIEREIMEETNMHIVKCELLGVQENYWSRGTEAQARFVCTVQPCGDFVSDPGGDIDKIELIDPANAKKYFDWGHIGEHVLDRALIKLKRLK
jgi:ADP-ribose pyrophosphatase YjhB (NUDIX family)